MPEPTSKKRKRAKSFTHTSTQPEGHTGTNHARLGQTSGPSRDNRQILVAKPTTVRISRVDKAEIATSNRGIFISLPKAFRKNRAAATSDLRLWVISQKLEGLQSVIASGDSFLVAIFEKTSGRDRAIKELQARRKSLKLNTGGEERTASDLVVHPFGEQAAARKSIWFIDAGPFDRHVHVADALVEWFSEAAVDLPNYRIRPVLFGNFPEAKFLVQFQTPPRWLGKEIQIKGQKRLVSAEGINNCRFCDKGDHSSWDCTTPGATRTAGATLVSFEGAEEEEIEGADFDFENYVHCIAHLQFLFEKYPTAEALLDANSFVISEDQLGSEEGSEDENRPVPDVRERVVPEPTKKKKKKAKRVEGEPMDEDR